MTNRTKTGLRIVTSHGAVMVISPKPKVMHSAAGYYIGLGYMEELFLF